MGYFARTYEGSTQQYKPLSCLVDSQTPQTKSILREKNFILIHHTEKENLNQKTEGTKSFNRREKSINR